MRLPLAAASAHLGLLGPLLIAGFLIGVYGHMSRSRPLILCGIAVIAAVSLYFVAAGEIQAF
ncbi:MAG TPA: hypothetical protein VHV75_04560 [Solirubrobacteraceae bacterium]|nr:hypothetical protein [Solirubrobacteraceae bacterium]